MKSIVVAYDKNKAIGYKNNLLWANELPADRRRLQDLTRGSAVIMGRKTYEAMGNILHGRLNIVITHKFFHIPGLILARGLDEAYQAAKEHGFSDVTIIGGQSIYEQALPDVKRIYATEVDVEMRNADAYFPKFGRPNWQEVARERRYADGTNRYNYDFVTYEQN